MITTILPVMYFCQFDRHNLHYQMHIWIVLPLTQWKHNKVYYNHKSFIFHRGNYHKLFMNKNITSCVVLLIAKGLTSNTYINNLYDIKKQENN